MNENRIHRRAAKQGEPEESHQPTLHLIQARCNRAAFSARRSTTEFSDFRSHKDLIYTEREVANRVPADAYRVYRRQGYGREAGHHQYPGGTGKPPMARIPAMPPTWVRA